MRSRLPRSSFAHSGAPISHALPRWKANGIKLARVVYAVVRDVVEGRLALHAASLVYTTILSLVPILALAFSILKGFGVHYRFEPLLMQALSPLGSQAQMIAERLMSFVDKMDVGVLGAVGLALLFYTAVSVVQKIEAACNEIWHVRQERPLARKITDYLSILLIGPVLMFSALGIAASVLASEPVRQLSEIRPLGVLIDMAIRAAPILLVVGTFTFLYKFIPNTRVPILSALVGGIVATLIWLLAGMAFATVRAGRDQLHGDLLGAGFAHPVLHLAGRKLADRSRRRGGLLLPCTSGIHSARVRARRP